MMAPWEIKGSDDVTLPHWLKLTPEDFYFALKREKNITSVCITPGEYYDHAGRMYPDSMPINRLIPIYLVEVSESVYHTSEPLNTVFSDMLRLGFIHDPDFQSFIEICPTEL